MGATTELRDMLDAHGIKVTAHRPRTKAELARENAKLRELVRDALATISWCTIDCYPSDSRKRELYESARELGVEVDG